MKIKTSELTGAALDWAVARADDVDYRVWKGMVVDECSNPLMYHDDWGLAGPIIERENLGVWWNGIWHAKYDGCGLNQVQDADTPLIAAMRCYVASKLGDEVEVPEELV
ncbi:MAG: phage protein NinX family protein [Plesiomonas shigelloides]